MFVNHFGDGAGYRFGDARPSNVRVAVLVGPASELCLKHPWLWKMTPEIGSLVVAGWSVLDDVRRLVYEFGKSLDILDYEISGLCFVNYTISLPDKIQPLIFDLCSVGIVLGDRELWTWRGGPDNVRLAV